MPVCGNYLFFELPKKIVLNPKDGWRNTLADKRTVRFHWRPNMKDSNFEKLTLILCCKSHIIEL